MPPVRMVLCPIEGIEQVDDFATLFLDDLHRFGDGEMLHSITMTAGALGAGSYHQIAIRPRTMLDLALLVEYAEECRHGFMLMVMIDGKSGMLPTPLSLHEAGEWLDDLPPPTTRPLNASSKNEDFVAQMEMVSDWQAMRGYVEQLELENRMLRHQLNR